jgi:hypothetical protein
VREHPQQAFALLWQPRASAQSRAQVSFVAGNGAFDLPTLAVHPVDNPPLHLAPIPGFRPMPLTPWVERDHRRPDRQPATAQLVVVFGIIGRIRHDTVPLRVSGGLAHGGWELGANLGMGPG